MIFPIHKDGCRSSSLTANLFLAFDPNAKTKISEISTIDVHRRSLLTSTRRLHSLDLLSQMSSPQFLLPDLPVQLDSQHQHLKKKNINVAPSWSHPVASHAQKFAAFRILPFSHASLKKDFPLASQFR